jgi:hypothetical protein
MLRIAGKQASLPAMALPHRTSTWRHPLDPAANIAAPSTRHCDASARYQQARADGPLLILLLHARVPDPQRLVRLLLDREDDADDGADHASRRIFLEHLARLVRDRLARAELVQERHGPDGGVLLGQVREVLGGVVGEVLGDEGAGGVEGDGGRGFSFGFDRRDTGAVGA